MSVRTMCLGCGGTGEEYAEGQGWMGRPCELCNGTGEAEPKGAIAARRQIADRIAQGTQMKAADSTARTEAYRNAIREAAWSNLEIDKPGTMTRAEADAILDQLEESEPASKTGPVAPLDDLAARLEAAGWTIDFRAEGATLRVSRDYPDEYFRHRLVVSDRNQLIPATVYLIEEGYDEDGSQTYACGPTLMAETLDALVLFRQYRDVCRSTGKES